uniref:glycoprotein-N-acetylgalactosamine 3-beta-galactosyltransferase 1-A-like isoform X2 n=1 Tax=Pristiophorus japonicus TaxID=55135 RepID=UPI00398E4696
MEDRIMAPSTCRSWMAFFLGILFGIFILYFFANYFSFEKRFNLQPEVRTVRNYSQEPSGRQTQELEGTVFSSGAPKSHLGKDSEIADSLYRKVRILCWVMTNPKTLHTKAKHVNATWARHCNTVLYMSSVKDHALFAVELGTGEGRDQLYWKTIRAFQYVHKHHLDEADWFMKADDDTYVIVDNLRWLLSKHLPGRPIYFGKRFKPYVKQGYMSGGAGVLSAAPALQSLSTTLTRT